MSQTALTTVVLKQNNYAVAAGDLAVAPAAMDASNGNSYAFRGFISREKTAVGERIGNAGNGDSVRGCIRVLKYQHFAPRGNMQETIWCPPFTRIGLARRLLSFSTTKFPHNQRGGCGHQNQSASGYPAGQTLHLDSNEAACRDGIACQVGVQASKTVVADVKADASKVAGKL